MWNAAATVTPALPNRDIRVRDVIIDGDLTIYGNTNEVIPLILNVTQEDGGTDPFTFKVLKLGNIVHLYVPEISVNELVYSQNFKTFTLPAPYIPVDINDYPIEQGSGGAEGLGTSHFNTNGVVELFTNPDTLSPTPGGAEAVTRPFTVVYFVA